MFILHFDLYAKLPLTSGVVPYVDQKGKFWPNNGYCDTQLWMLKLLSVLKLAEVSHIHQGDLYLQLVLITLACFLFFFFFLEVANTWWICKGENWQHSIILDKVLITLDYVCICSGKKWEHEYNIQVDISEAKEHQTWKVNASIQTPSLIKPYHSSWKACIPSLQTS